MTHQHSESNEKLNEIVEAMRQLVIDNESRISALQNAFVRVQTQLDDLSDLSQVASTVDGARRACEETCAEILSGMSCLSETASVLQDVRDGNLAGTHPQNSSQKPRSWTCFIQMPGKPKPALRSKQVEKFAVSDVSGIHHLLMVDANITSVKAIDDWRFIDNVEQSLCEALGTSVVHVVAVDNRSSAHNIGVKIISVMTLESMKRLADNSATLHANGVSLTAENMYFNGTSVVTKNNNFDVRFSGSFSNVGVLCEAEHAEALIKQNIENVNIVAARPDAVMSLIRNIENLDPQFVRRIYCAQRANTDYLRGK